MKSSAAVRNYVWINATPLAIVSSYIGTNRYPETLFYSLGCDSLAPREPIIKMLRNSYLWVDTRLHYSIEMLVQQT